VAARVDNITVINGSPTEADILTECGIEAADAYVAASNDDDSNLISSVLAKKMGARSAIITTQQPDYLTIINELRIDAIINPHLLAVKQILHLVRGRGISSVTKFQETDAEVLELVPEEGAPVTRDILKNIKFPKDAIIGAVCRDSEASLANGETRIKPGDNVIVFCAKNASKKMQQFFTR
jgi:trk system potassium uptake protein TrkA